MVYGCNLLIAREGGDTVAKRGRHKKSPASNNELTIAKLLLCKALIELVNAIVDLISRWFDQ